MRVKFIWKKNDIGWALAGGVVFAMIFVFGFSLETFNGIDYKNILLWVAMIGAFVLFSALFFLLFTINVYGGKTNHNHRPGDKPIRFGLIMVALLGIIYAVWGLGAYPGFFAYDAPWQWWMYSDNVISLHHPVLHTLMIGWCLELGKNLFGTVNKGAFIYTIIQTFFSVLSFSHALSFLYSKKVSRKLLVFAFVWFAFAPTVVINVLSATKDSIFAVLTLSFTILTIQMVGEPPVFWGKWYRVLAWGALAVLSAIMRNNAVYAVALLLIVLGVVNRKYWKKYLVTVMAAGLLFAIYSGPICNSVAEKGMDEEEYYSIPLQQILWVYMNDRDKMTADEIEMTEVLFEEICFENYNSQIADMPKYHSRLDTFTWKKWAKLGTRFPADYANAFLCANMGLWYPWPDLIVDVYGEQAYLICHSYDPVFDDSFISPIYQYLSIFEKSDMILHNNWGRWLFSPGTWFCFFFSVFLLSVAKKTKIAVVLSYLFVYWMTFLLGPVALVRYVSYIFYLVPILLWIAMDIKQKTMTKMEQQ